MLIRVALVLAIWLALAVPTAILLGKWLKRRRKKAEENKGQLLLMDADPDPSEVAKVRLAISNYISNCLQDDSLASDRTLQPRDLCAVCFQEGFCCEEDDTPPFAVIDDHCIPSCAKHKAFIMACVERKIFSEI